MDPLGELIGTNHREALQFFLLGLQDLSEPTVDRQELLYNASVLAHFATTSISSTTDFPPSPASLSTVFDVFVLDRSQHTDPDIMEAAGSQCLMLTGFFQDQLRRRHNVDWFANLGARFYISAALLSRDAARIRLLRRMGARFGYWRKQQRRLAKELREEAHLFKWAVN